MITTGGDRYFSTGMDVDWMRQSSPAVLDGYHDELHRLYNRILTLGVPTVAVVNGKRFVHYCLDILIMQGGGGGLIVDT